MYIFTTIGNSPHPLHTYSQYLRNSLIRNNSKLDSLYIKYYYLQKYLIYLYNDANLYNYAYIYIMMRIFQNSNDKNKDTNIDKFHFCPDILQNFYSNIIRKYYM